MQFQNQTHYYQGKVRDVYTISNQFVVMIASNRISAFDVILPRPIPYKGQVLNQIAAYFLQATSSIVPNWLIASPLPHISVGKKCIPFAVEMVIRGNLTGHAWRTYKSGERTLCGVNMPEGMKEFEFFSEPIITPSTKAHEGHDEDISREEILKRGIVSESDYILLEKYTRELFAMGKKMATARGLILADTKYEFGKIGDTIYLIDEIHTPDSSRYFYVEGFEEKLIKGESPKQLSKEFVREWLISQGFMGKDEQQVPAMSDTFVEQISARYIELYEMITGLKFEKKEIDEPKIETQINEFLQTLVS